MPDRNPEFVPGAMRCAKCNFRLQRTNLYMQSGTTGPGGNETEPCPNGCGPLWPVTWRQEAHELGERLEAQFEELSRAHTLIARLHREGVLSEGQCCKALEMERVAFRRMVDWRAPNA